VLANSVSLAGLLRDGRCAVLEVVGPLLNADADSRTNDVDALRLATRISSRHTRGTRA